MKTKRNYHHIRNVALWVLISLFGFGGMSCSTNPVTGRQEFLLFHPTMQEQVQIGQSYAPEVQQQLGGPIDNPAIQSYVNEIGQKIARVSHKSDLEFHFMAVEDTSANAVALPGGYIFITRGMLNLLETEAQLAGVLAHEVAHVTAEHTAAMIERQMGMSLVLSAISGEKTPQAAVQVANIAANMVSLKYSRDFERESDTIGMDYLVKAGYNPEGIVGVMQHLNDLSDERPLEFFSTHPNPENRIDLLRGHMREKGYPATGVTGAQEYMNNIKAKL